MSPKLQRKRFVVGVTGASGAMYCRRLIQCLVRGEVEVHLIVTTNGKRLLADELAIKDVSAESLLGESCDALTIHSYRNVGDVLGSGSFRTDGMVICPCSSNTLAAVATGLADNLLNRAACVTLKEARKLIIVPREMPMSRIDLLNALRLSEAGAVICPASPGFYMLPKSVDDLVDFVVGKIMDLLGVAHELDTRWARRVASTDRPRRRSAE